ncbi:SRPBCC family protein [Arthrobacter sp. UYEF3]|uniref:SRPBCC family protein n=1 Tax=Arthrobacter sp. UYEF3 TaxID=1756365 RepID=UPI003397B787
MKFSVTRRVGTSADVVWGLLTDRRQWPAWGPSITGVTPAAGEASGTELTFGSRGKVRTVLGVALPYVVTAFEPGRSWSWSVAGIRATGHRVTPQDGGCLVTFSVPWWAAAYLPVCALALRRIERLATGSVTPVRRRPGQD